MVSRSEGNISLLTCYRVRLRRVDICSQDLLQCLPVRYPAMTKESMRMRMSKSTSSGIIFVIWTASQQGLRNTCECSLLPRCSIQPQGVSNKRKQLCFQSTKNNLLLKKSAWEVNSPPLTELCAALGEDKLQMP